jgi:hypothetical protein
MSDTKRIFVSYSHQDEAWCDAVAQHLRTLHDPIQTTVWVDRHRIRAGTAWAPEIDKGLQQADLAVLLISPAFLSSEFIRNTELPKLLASRTAGLPVIPILIMPCGWKAIGWLQSHELRPRGDRALAEFGDLNSAAVNRQLGNLVEEIAKILEEQPTRKPPPEGEARTEERDEYAGHAAALLAATLLQQVSVEARTPLAERIVERIARFCALSGEALFNALRVFIEYQLLRPEPPDSPQQLDKTLNELAGDKLARRLVGDLKQGAKTGDFGASVVEVNSRFFMLAREREDLWETYFDELAKFAESSAATTAPSTLCRIRVTRGFIAPQFLVAGLLSHFDDDWRPVLNAYRHSIPNPKLRAGVFESLQASQWNCWLVWGPSIPICRCAQWQGKFAYQYGYGDENNSLPLIELDLDEARNPRTLDPLVRGFAAERRAAKLIQLTGRLRWGPHFLGPAVERPDNGEGELDAVDESDRDEDEGDEPPRRYPMAAAQEILYCGEGPGHAHHSDGLVLQLEQVDLPVEETRVYFSAYLWVMFLVTVAAQDPSDPAIGPQLLRRKRYPPWPEQPAERFRVRDARLWEDLLPVFVPANVADPAALRFQRRVLVDSALQMLRQVWERRAECFDADDVATGIRFHLVCASDYSGCDCAVRYPPDETLTELLRQRLATESAADFAAAVQVPGADERSADRPWGLAGYFSACHLPELVADYFNYVGQIYRQQSRR